MKGMLVSTSVVLMFGLGPACQALHAQGMINGGFELYDPETKFLQGWHVKFGNTVDLGTTVGGVSGSLLDYEQRELVGLFATIYGMDNSLEHLPVGQYFFLARGPAVTVEQRVSVPTDAASLQYRALGGALGGVSVQIDGVTIEPQLKEYVPPTSGLADWWVDMRPYTGRSIDLTFYIGQGIAGFDNVHFATEVVPEPAVITLAGLGAAALFAARRKCDP